MTTSKHSNGSLFDYFVTELNKKTATPPLHYRVVDIDIDQTIDKFIVVLSLSYHHIGNNVSKTHVVVIDKDDFEAWVEKTERLIMMSDPTENGYELTITFDEFMDEYFTKSDMREYITNKKLDNGYGWSI